MVRKLHVLFSACMLSLAVALPQAAVGAGLDPRLYVIVSNQAKAPADLLDDAISELSRIYRTIGVELTAGTALPADFTGSFVAVTIARSRQCRLMRLSELALGSAVPGGTLAFVMYDRVVTLSSRTGLRQSEGLALVMAHEIGHLLMPEGKHAKFGLMAASWTSRDLRFADTLGLGFQHGEAATIRAQLAIGR